ncbi:MAG TPA: hypothetical protein VER32_08145 [Pyrinomonadaceae bacterium]|nr:hypothetical protein [Pyrinomonadaceae bacterium]
MDETIKTDILTELAGEAALSPSGRALLRCRLAKKLEETGDYEEARELLSPFWRGVGERPRLEELDDEAASELLLRAGVLSGWLGTIGATRTAGAQGAAKDLIGESLARFEESGRAARAADAQTELAYCYWREGAFDEARVLLRQVLERLGGGGDEVRAVALLRLALVESSATRFSDSLRLLLDAAPVFEASRSDALKGRFHNELAYNFQSLASTENRADYIDRALVEFTAAAFHFERAGHARYRAHVENNLALLHHALGRHEDAHEHLDRARSLAPGAENAALAATVDETRARVLISQGRLARAEETARAACEVFERAGEAALLAEALTTRGTALARLGRDAEARDVLERAAEVAEQSGSVEAAGVALVTLIEELPARLSSEETRDFYRRADELLARSQHPETLARLRRAARHALDAPEPNEATPERADAAARERGAQSVAGSGQREAEKLAAVEELVAGALGRRDKRVTFTSEALEVMSRMFLQDGMRELRSLVEETIAAAPPEALITPDDVEVVALRGSASRSNFAEPWAGFSLKDELRHSERRFIELALKAAGGKVSVAARLLGFGHNELLTSIIKSRHPELLAARTPVVPRRRSIIRKPRPPKR